MNPAGQKEIRDRGRRQHGRPPASREPHKIVLIVCEGGKTEPNYFTWVIHEMGKLVNYECHVKGKECGSHPRSVVEYAKSIRNDFQSNGFAPKDIDIWCVFDRDDHPKIDEAMKMARDNDFKLAFSNPCFELWYLLHFQDQTASINRKKVLSCLRKYLPKSEYKKDFKEFGLLIVKQSDAIRRAKQLRKNHLSAGNAETENPSTSVDQLVEFLRNLPPRA